MNNKSSQKSNSIANDNRLLYIAVPLAVLSFATIKTRRSLLNSGLNSKVSPISTQRSYSGLALSSGSTFSLHQSSPSQTYSGQEVDPSNYRESEYQVAQQSFYNNKYHQ